MNNENSITLKTTILDNKRIAYSSRTLFEVQLGKGRSSYKTVRSFEGNLMQAVMHYNMLNVHSGYKKRLLSYDLNKPVLARLITE